MFVALDLETTGFDPLLDEVIEIAAVKFDREKVLETFQTLLNPRRDIPRIVEHITGIAAKDVEKAPFIEDVAESLINFVGDLPIVGHNINFDVDFLNKKGFNFKNQRYDTLDLASILLPEMPSYSLDTLTRVLHIEHTDRHRALSDTIASQQLFCRLLQEIDKLDEKSLSFFQSVLKKSSWAPKILFYKDTQTEEASPVQNMPGLNDLLDLMPQLSSIEGSIPQIESLPVSLTSKNFIDEIAPFLNRQSLDFLETLVSSTLQNESFLCEFPSLIERRNCYLLTGWFLKRSTGKTLVVATTELLNAFKPSLDEKLEKHLVQHSQSPLVIAYLKAPSEYISLKRLEKFLARPLFEAYETTFLLKILLWLQKTQNGDLSELRLQGKEFSLLEDICCQDNETMLDQELYWQKALIKAQHADLLVLNFKFLLQEKLVEHDVLPPESFLILDDAIDLEEITTQFLSLNIGFSSFIKPFEKLQHSSPHDGISTTPTEAIDTETNISNVKKLPLTELIQQIVSRTEIFFGLLGILYEKKIEYQEDSGFSLAIIEAADEERLEWQKLKASAESLYELINKLIDADISPDYQSLFLERQKLLSTIFHFEKTLQDQLELKHVTWMAKTREGSVYLKSAPQDIGPIFQKYFFDQNKPLALLSSCSTVKDSFYLLRQQLGLKSAFKEIIFPFKLPDPAVSDLFAPHDLPKPSSDNHFLTAANIIKDAIISTKGKTVVLFSSKRSLTGTCLQINPELKQCGFEIIAEGITGGQGKITEYYKREKDKVALFATSGFWQQLKIPPEDIQCLILHKLPFGPPQDPLLKFRGKNFADPFNDYHLPRAVLFLKKTIQHFFQKRATPSKIILLDSRIFNTSYGKAFLESFPENLPRKTCNYNKLFL